MPLTKKTSKKVSMTKPTPTTTRPKIDDQLPDVAQIGGSGYPLLVGNIGESPSADLVNRYVNPQGNPQALQDLDAVFAQSPGPSGYGVMGGGGIGCGDEGTNTQYKTHTFKDLMSHLNSYIDNKEAFGMKKQSGGGAAFSVNPENYIAGMPVIDPYDSKAAPALLNGRLASTASSNDLMGCQAGGSKHKKSKSNKKSHRRQSKKKTGSKKRSSGGGYKKSHRKVSRKHKKQSGGDFTNGMNSKPAPYCDAFNGPLSDLREPVTFATRNFAGRQPFWGPDAL